MKKINKTEWTQGGRTYNMGKRIGEHWALFVNGITLPLLEDSANEDYYEYDSARAAFETYINNYEDEIVKFITDYDV